MALSIPQRKYVEKQYNEGASGGQIAAVLGVTRNTVIGHINRQINRGVLKRRSNILPFRKPPASSKPIIAHVGPKPVKEIPEPPCIGPLNDFPKAHDADHQACQYTKDDPGRGDWRMCGQPTRNITRKFCDAHHIVCHQQKWQSIEDQVNGTEERTPESGELQGSQAQPGSQGEAAVA